MVARTSPSGEDLRPTGVNVNAVIPSLFVDNKFHLVEVANPAAYADSFWRVDANSIPRLFHRLTLRVFASLWVEIESLRRKAGSGSILQNQYEECLTRFNTIVAKVRQVFPDELVRQAASHHPEFPTPLADWDCVSR